MKLAKFTSPIMRKTIKFKGDFTMLTIIVNVIVAAATMALGAGLGIMIYAKTRTDKEKEDMGIQF